MTASAASGGSSAALRRERAPREVVTGMAVALAEQLHEVALSSTVLLAHPSCCSSVPRPVSAEASALSTGAAGKGRPAGRRACRRRPSGAAARQSERRCRRRRRPRLVDQLRGDALDCRGHLRDAAWRERLTSPRMRVCSGASAPMITGIRPALVQHGLHLGGQVDGRRRERVPRAVLSSFSTVRTSSYRVTTQKPNRSAKKTGARSRAPA